MFVAARQLCVTALLLSATPAMSAEYNKTWTDKNYVPCEGLGLTATGQIELTIKYDKKHWVRFAEEGQPAPEFDYYDIRSIFLETSYNHAHEASATLDYQGAPLVDEGGGKQTVMAGPLFQIDSFGVPPISVT